MQILALLAEAETTAQVWGGVAIAVATLAFLYLMYRSS